ncbi:hypothetical protein BO71DRAFT_401629 [Aspergillus ellipticus CBS 707.79]|uniref:Uncharacterized protein n=1 Tax=Aspergillus ellipticus CBS 707.79 TaxID=1448320 RepID=A0A319D2B0_9EURO|nr:hypothetical protein BO71DRAFT_401629 [Aspergillus ellipticus CBS 707.79]
MPGAMWPLAAVRCCRLQTWLRFPPSPSLVWSSGSCCPGLSHSSETRDLPEGTWLRLWSGKGGVCAAGFAGRLAQVEWG